MLVAEGLSSEVKRTGWGLCQCWLQRMEYFSWFVHCFIGLFWHNKYTWKRLCMCLRKFCSTLIFYFVRQTEILLSLNEMSNLGPLKWYLPLGLTVLQSRDAGWTVVAWCWWGP